MEGASSQPVLPLDNDLGRLESEEKDQLWTQFVEEWKRTWLRTQWPLSNQPQGQERTGWSRVGDESRLFMKAAFFWNTSRKGCFAQARCPRRWLPLAAERGDSCLEKVLTETQISSNVNGQNGEHWSPKAGSWAAVLVQRAEGGGEAWISGVFPAHLSKTPS